MEDYHIGPLDKRVYRYAETHFFFRFSLPSLSIRLHVHDIFWVMIASETERQNRHGAMRRKYCMEHIKRRALQHRQPP